MGQEKLSGHLEQFSTDGLSLEEDRKLVELLSKWKGGRISTPVFTEIARMIPQPIVEVVLFRESEGVLETLLIPRPVDDIVWPGMYHTPGTALRASDYSREDQNPLNGSFERIQNGEIEGKFRSAPIFIGRLYGLSRRGPSVSEIYFTELADGFDRPHHLWYPVDKLAENPQFIQEQLKHVLWAAEQYKNRIKSYQTQK
jgi:hypothetical protein